MPFFEIPYNDLLNVMNSTKQKLLPEIVDLIIERNEIFKDQDKYINELREKVNRFLKTYRAKIQESSRHINRLTSTDWFQTGSIKVGCDSDTTPKKRASKDFASCCERTKKRKSDVLLQSEHSEDIIRYTSNRIDNKQDDNINPPQNVKAALAFFIDMGLTVEKWRKLRSYVKQYGNNFPEYRKIKEEKEKCYPENIEVTEKSASIKLQSLLDHTSRKILETKTSEELQKYQGKELFLISKWGMDGSSGHSQYKQNFLENDKATDQSLVCTSMVPIKLFVRKGDVPLNEEVNTLSEEDLSLVIEDTVWQNPKPSSTRYCRPIKFEFAKETAEYTQQEYAKIKEEIQNLESTMVKIGDSACSITHILELTMVDGKVCYALSCNKSSATCNICNTKPSQMQNIDEIKKKPCNEEVYKFGLSTLHCLIRFMENILHISYRLPVYQKNSNGNTEKLTNRKSKYTDDEKILMEQRKKEVQESLKRELQITVDVVKQGSGTTNDGNTARKFFSDPQKTALATGVDEDLITRFSNILQVLTSGHKINCEKFEKYANETAKIYVNKYPWYYMPTSVHKVLMHGSAVIRSFLLPIGQLSEEALEAGNRVFRNTRLFHARKTSRIDNLMDIIHYLLACSDPSITSYRIVKEKKHLEYSETALELLED